MFLERQRIVEVITGVIADRIRPDVRAAGVAQDIADRLLAGTRDGGSFAKGRVQLAVCRVDSKTPLYALGNLKTLASQIADALAAEASWANRTEAAASKYHKLIAALDFLEQGR